MRPPRVHIHLPNGPIRKGPPDSTSARAPIHYQRRSPATRREYPLTHPPHARYRRVRLGQDPSSCRFRDYGWVLAPKPSRRASFTTTSACSIALRATWRSVGARSAASDASTSAWSADAKPSVICVSFTMVDRSGHRDAFAPWSLDHTRISRHGPFRPGAGTAPDPIPCGPQGRCPSDWAKPGGVSNSRRSGCQGATHNGTRGTATSRSSCPG